jgi:putative nucleotidyltransferase with HDIG domain
MNNRKEISLKKIENLFSQYGHESYGEDLTQQEHMLQTAMLAEMEGYGNEVIAAAFLHDIGHLYADDESDGKTSRFGAANHDQLGATLLQDMGFPDKTVALVRGHVQAKRYLAFKKPDYLVNLSHASMKTLEMQGGAMTDEEASVFESDPWFKLHIKLREWDDSGKIPGLKAKPIACFFQLLDKVIRPETEDRL